MRIHSKTPARALLTFAILFHVPLAALAGADVADREIAALDTEGVPLVALPLSEAPGATTVITSEEIARSGAANIFELLRRVPGVDIRYTPMGGHIAIRSSGASPFSEEVLLLIDGSPYNSPDKGGFPGHPNYSGFFPLDRIARIEVIKGPISVLYGANAFGGVINIVSKQAADAVADRVEGAAYGATIVAGGRNTLERSLRSAWVKGGWDATIEAGASDGDTPVKLNGEAVHSRRHLYAAIRRGNFWTSLLHQESRNGSLSFEGVPTQDAHHDVDIVDAHYERKAGEFILRAAATLNRYRGTTCAECHNALTLAPDDAKTDDVGKEIETDQRIRAAFRADRVLSQTQDLTIGVEAAEDSVDRRIVRLDEAPKDLDSGGFFVQHQWHLRGRSLHVISGLRQDTAERLGSVTSPRIALVSEPAANLILRASWSRAFRAPTWNERFIRQRFIPEDLAPGLILVFQGNPELKRERIDAAEAGVSWRFHPKAVVKLDLYHHQVSEFIYRTTSLFVPGNPNEIRNVYGNREEPFTVRGGELTLLTRPLETLSLTAAYGYRDLSLNTDDQAAAYAPRGRAILTAAWSPAPRWALDLSASHSSRYTVSSPEVFGVRPQHGYSIIDASAHYTLPVARTQLTFGLAGRNLLDEQPKETLVGPDIDTSLRGRTVVCELRVDF